MVIHGKYHITRTPLQTSLLQTNVNIYTVETDKQKKKNSTAKNPRGLQWKVFLKWSTFAQINRKASSPHSFLYFYCRYSPKHQEALCRLFLFHCRDRQSTGLTSASPAENGQDNAVIDICKPFSWWSPTKGRTTALLL